MAVVVAKAMAMTRGSWREGAANRVVSGATASQPTNDSMRVEAAWPMAAQSGGADGVQLAVWADGADPASATMPTAISRATSISCTIVVAQTPPKTKPS